MAGITWMSEAAALGLHALALLARAPGGRLTTREAAAELAVSEAHLAKVLQRLERKGLVRGKRGPAGGFGLLRDPDTVSLRDIYEILDGPLPRRTCLLGRPPCNRRCPLGGLLREAEQRVAEGMEDISLHAFARTFGWAAGRGRQKEEEATCV